MQYSYLVELKYLKLDDTTTNVENLLQKNEVQLRRCASDEKVVSTTGHTRLRLLAAVYRGWQSVAMREFV